MMPSTGDRSNSRLLSLDFSKMTEPLCHLSSKKQLACETCHGLGYRVAPVGAFVEADLCSCVINCPVCFGQARKIKNGASVSCRSPSPKRIANLLTNAQIPARFHRATLNHFDNFSGNGQETIHRIQKILRNIKPIGQSGIILSGPVGVGKTHMLAAMARNLVEQGYSVRFTDFFQLLAELRAGFSDGKADSTLLAPLIAVDFLLIDELGKGRGKDFDKTVIDQLVTGRYNQNKTILATTNYQLKTSQPGYLYNVELDRDPSGMGDFAPDRFGPLDARVGSRIFSRLQQMTDFLHLTGKDYRSIDRK